METELALGDSVDITNGFTAESQTTVIPVLSSVLVGICQPIAHERRWCISCLRLQELENNLHCVQGGATSRDPETNHMKPPLAILLTAFIRVRNTATSSCLLATVHSVPGRPKLTTPQRSPLHHAQSQLEQQPLIVGHDGLLIRLPTPAKPIIQRPEQPQLLPVLILHTTRLRALYTLPSSIWRFCSILRISTAPLRLIFELWLWSISWTAGG